MAKKLKCNCGKPAVFVQNSSVVYGFDYGPLWMCPDYPECDCYVGCHRGTTEPLGTLANYDTREARKRAHAAFDPLWQTMDAFRDRSEAYEWLRYKVGVTVERAHIGMLTIRECDKLVAACELL